MIERYRDWKAKGGSGQPTDSDSSDSDDNDPNTHDTDGWVETIRDKNKSKQFMLTDNLVKSTEAKLDINVPSASNVPGTSSNLGNHKMTNIKSNTVSSSSNLAASLNSAKAASGGGHFFKSKNDDDSDEETAGFSNSNNRSNSNHVNNSNGAIEAALLGRSQNVSSELFWVDAGMGFALLAIIHCISSE